MTATPARKPPLPSPIVPDSVQAPEPIQTRAAVTPSEPPKATPTTSKTSEPAAFRVRKSRAKPRLLGAGETPLPPPPSAEGAPLVDPTVAAAPAALWTAGGAQELFTGAHNIPGAVLLLRNPPALAAWHAEASELNGAGDSLARLLDRLGPPGAGGLAGTIGDVIIGLNAVVTLEMTKWTAVKHELEKQHRVVIDQTGAPAPDTSTPPQPPPSRAAPVPPTGPSSSPPNGGGRFRHDEKVAKFLATVPSAVNTGDAPEGMW